MRAVVEEAQRASAARSVVDYLCHHRSAVVKEELVAYSYLARRLYEDVPQAHFLVQLTQQKHLNLGVGLLLCTV